MARDKSEEQALVFPLDGGVDNVSLAQSVQPPTLVASVNTRLSVTRGVPVRAPHFASVTSGTITAPCQGIVPTGAHESTLAFAVGASKRVANGVAASYLDNRGTQKNMHVPSRVSRAGVLPGGGSFCPAAIAYDTVNACHWVASLRRYSSTQFAIYVCALSADGEVIGQTKAAYICTGTPTWFSLTAHGASGVYLWYCDVDASLAIKARALSLSGGVVTFGTATSIYTPVQCAIGQAAVVSDGSTKAYLATHHSSTATTLAVHTVTVPGLTVSTATKASFHSSGARVDIAYHSSKVLVATARVASGTNAIMYTSGVETWNNTTSVSGLDSDEVACGFAVIGGSTYAVLAITANDGDLSTTSSGNQVGTYLEFMDYDDGASAYGHLVPWMRPVSKLSQLTIGSSIYPIMTMHRKYTYGAAVTDEEFITDPSVEVMLFGHYSAACVGRFGVDDVPHEPEVISGSPAICHSDTKYTLSYRSMRHGDFDIAASVRYVELDFASHQPRYALTSEGSALIAGGNVLSWDGETLTEANPIHRPTMYVGTTGAGATLTTGAYRFSAVHAWQDANGITHRSMPAVVRSISGSGMEATAWVAKPCSSRDYLQNESLYTEWYASLLDGTVLYRQYVTNTSASSYYDLRDTFAQPEASDITPIIYSDGDPSQELMSQCPPAASDIVMVGDRCWLISAERPNELWPSKRRLAGVAYEWNSDIKLRLNGSCGNAVSLAELGGQLLVMTSTGVFLINGQGPDNVGNGSWADPQKISDIACTSCASTISTPTGVMFVSGNRFARVSAQGAVEIGNIDASLLGDVVTAVLDKPRQEALWIGTSLTYCYNYGLDRWTTWEHVPAPSCAAMTQAGLVVWSSGALYQASMSSVSESAQMLWTTGDITFGGPHDDCVVTDVLIHGQRVGSHGITVTLTPDYGQATAVTRTFSAAEVLSATSNGQYTLSCSIGTHSMRALKVSVQETGQTTGLGARPTSVTIMVAKNPGTKRDAVKPGGRK